MPRLPPAATLVPVVAGAALLAFATALHGSFVNWDDRWLVVENESLRSFAAVPRILDPTADRMDLGAEYLPLRDLSNLVDWQFFGAEPRGYRLGNWLLHALAAAAAFLFLLEGLRSRAAALAGSLLWAVHPLHAEVVGWASARKDSLNAVFALLAAALYLRSARTGARRSYLLALAAFVAATLSKTSAAALPLALLAWEVLAGDRTVPAGRRVGRAALRALPFLLVAAAGAWVNAVHQNNAWRSPTWRGGGWLENTFLVAGIHLRYLRQCVLPYGLSPAYPAGGADAASATNLAGVVFAVTAVAALPALARRAPLVAAPMLWWGLLLLPVSNLLVPLSNLSADRYVFLPSLGPAALAGLAWAAWERRAPRPALAVLLAAALALGAAAAVQVRHWRNSIALWDRAVAACPGSGKAWQVRAAALASAGRRREALESFRAMVDAEPWDAVWWTLAGSRFFALGGPDLQPEVEALLRHAVTRAGPRNPGPLLALSAYYGLAGRTAEARAALDDAARREADHAEVRVCLGFARLADGNAAAARAEFERALRFPMPPAEEHRVRETLVRLAEDAGDAAGAEHHRAGLRLLGERSGERER